MSSTTSQWNLFKSESERQEARRALSKKPAWGTQEAINFRSRELWFDTEIYQILKHCSITGELDDWEDWCEMNPGASIWLQGADLQGFHLTGINLSKANLQKARLENTHLEDSILLGACLDNAKLYRAHLERADLHYAHLDNAWFLHAHLEGTKLVPTSMRGTVFCGAIVDGETTIWRTVHFSEREGFIRTSEIDDDTDFTGVGLESTRIEPSLLARLKINIRRRSWKEHYEDLERTPSGKIKVFFLKLFWGLSDYGSSTSKVLSAFLTVACFFTLFYIDTCLAAPGTLKDISAPPIPLLNEAPLQWFLWIWDIFCFSIATMVTLGFGGINVAMTGISRTARFFGVTLVTMNLLTGYFLLAVLVTRIGILFQSLGPEQMVGREKMKD